MPLDLLCHLLTMTGKALAVSDFASEAHFDVLVQFGCIEEGLLLSSVVCDECDSRHSAAIRYCDDRNSYGWDCHQHGFITRERNELRAFRINAEALAGMIADSLTNTRNNVRRLDASLFRVTHVFHAGVDITVYLLTRLDAASMRAAGSALSAEPVHFRKLLLTPGALNLVKLRLDGAIFAQLQHALRFDPIHGITAEPWRIARLAGIEVQGTRGRPSQFQPMLDDFIARRDREGCAATSIMAEAQTILKSWNSEFPETAAPGLTSAKNAVRDFRGVNKGQK